MFLKQKHLNTVIPLRSVFGGGSTASYGVCGGTFLLVPMVAVIKRTGARLDYLQCP